MIRNTTTGMKRIANTKPTLGLGVDLLEVWKREVPNIIRNHKKVIIVE